MNFCPVCNGSLQERLSGVSDTLTGESFSIFQCPRCLVRQTLPQPENLLKYYRAYHGGRHGFTAKFRAWRQAAMLGQPGNGAKILDVGCGDGTFLNFAKQAGWQVVGVELSRDRKPDWIEILPDISEVKNKYGLGVFSAVTLWHSLEHFKDPKQIIEAVNELLRPGGTILISVPNSDSWQARVFGKYWFHNDVPRHLFHFSEDALRNLLKSAGFSVVTSKHREFEYDLFGWSQSALNMFNKKPNVFFNILIGRTEGLGLFEIGLNFLFGTIFSFFALPLVAVTSLLRSGGTFVVKAKKIADADA